MVDDPRKLSEGVRHEAEKGRKAVQGVFVSGLLLAAPGA